MVVDERRVGRRLPEVAERPAVGTGRTGAHHGLQAEYLDVEPLERIEIGAVVVDVKESAHLDRGHRATLT